VTLGEDSGRDSEQVQDGRSDSSGCVWELILLLLLFARLSRTVGEALDNERVVEE
jgi:hypothetical protein